MLRLAAPDESAGMHPKGWEAIENQAAADMSLAIEFASQMAGSVKNGAFDQHFEPPLMVVGDQDGQKAVKFVHG